MSITAFTPASLCHTGQALLEQGETGRALPFFSKALELAPDHLEALLLRAAALLQEFDSERALADLSRALELAPDHLETLLTRGRAALSLGRRQQGEEDFSRALALAPLRPDIWQLRGQAREGCGQYRRASADYRQALALGHDQPRLLAEQLGCCHLALGEYEVCEEFMRQSRQKAGTRNKVIDARPGRQEAAGELPRRQALLATGEPSCNHRLAGLIRQARPDKNDWRFTTARSVAEVIAGLCRTPHDLVCCGVDRLVPAGSTGPEVRLQLITYIRQRHPGVGLLCLVPPLFGASYRRQLLDAGAHRVVSVTDPDPLLLPALADLLSVSGQ